jgi:MFS family permease
MWVAGLLGTLYFSQGLPFGFFTQSLPVLLREAGVSLAGIGLVNLLALPWALKFLWAPLVDRTAPGPRGKRGWILPLQLLTAMALLACAAMEPEGGMRAILGIVLFVNLMAATQDIATDGLAVDILLPHERGLANGLQVAAYRAGMVVGGGVILMLLERLGWRWSMVGMAAVLLLATLPVWRWRAPVGAAPLSREQPHADHRPAPGAARWGFWHRTGAVPLFVLVVTYKAGDAIVGAMIRPWMVDRGMSMTEIGFVLGTMGFVAALAGAMTGGALIHRLGRRTALVAFGFAQAASLTAFWACAVTAPPAAWVLAGIAVEHFVSSMATAALFTCMMDWTRPQFPAGDYTIQASAVVVSSGVAAAVSGALAQHHGYGLVFGLGALVSVMVTSGVLLFPSSWFVSRPERIGASTM